MGTDVDCYMYGRVRLFGFSHAYHHIYSKNLFELLPRLRHINGRSALYIGNCLILIPLYAGDETPRAALELKKTAVS